MHPDEETYDIMSVTVTAVVAIMAVALMVLHLPPGLADEARERQDPAATLGGRAVDYGSSCVPIGEEFDRSWLDFDGNGMLEPYDYDLVLSAGIDCSRQRCDVTGDGLVDARDREAFLSLLRRLYDYDGDGALTRDDPRFLRDILYGDAACDEDHLCDLDGDGRLCADDLARYTSLLYNYDTVI